MTRSKVDFPGTNESDRRNRSIRRSRTQSVTTDETVSATIDQIETAAENQHSIENRTVETSQLDPCCLLVAKGDIEVVDMHIESTRGKYDDAALRDHGQSHLRFIGGIRILIVGQLFLVGRLTDHGIF